MNYYGMQSNCTFQGFNSNQYNIQSSNNANNFMETPMNEIASLFSKIDFVLGGDKVWTKTDSTFDREISSKLAIQKLNTYDSGSLSIQSSYKYPPANFNWRQPITPQNSSSQNKQLYSDGLNYRGNGSIDSILKDITKITWDLDSMNNYQSGPKQNKYVPLNYAINGPKYSLNKMQSIDYSAPAERQYYNQGLDESLDSMIKNITNISQNLRMGPQKQSQFIAIDPTPHFGFYKEKENLPQHILLPLSRKSEVSENLQADLDSPSSRRLSTERSKQFKDAEISPMKFQPDFNSENIKEVQTYVDAEERHSQIPIDRDKAAQPLSLQDKSESGK